MSKEEGEGKRIKWASESEGGSGQKRGEETRPPPSENDEASKIHAGSHRIGNIHPMR